MAERHLVGIGFGKGQKGPRIGRRKILFERNGRHRLGDEPDRRERCRRILQIGIDRIGRRIGADIADGNRIAIGLGARGPRQAGGPACTRDILIDDALAEHLAHVLGNQTRDDIGRAACGKRHDHGDASRGECFLRRGGSQTKG